MSRFFKSAAFPILIVVVLGVPRRQTRQPELDQQALAQLPDARQLRAAQRRSRIGRAEEQGQSARSQAQEQRNLRNRLHRPGRARSCSAQLEKTSGVKFNVESEKSSALLSLLTYIIPFVLFFGFWIFLMNQVQGGGSKVMSFGKSRAKRMSADSPKITFRDVAGVDEAVEELHEIKEFLENPEEVPGARRADPDGGAAVRAAGHRQDAARARGRRRGGRAVLLDLRLGLRRDVRRRRRLARARPVRAGQAEQPVHHLHGRDRRRRASPRRRASAAATTSASRRSTSCSSRWTASRRRTTSS